MILGLVCAHASSEGCPDKSLMTLGGRNLLQIAIDKARDSGVVDRVALVTDYDARYATGFDVRIPREYDTIHDGECGPRVSKWRLWQYALERWTVDHEPPEAIVDVDVSRPLTVAEDVRGTVESWRKAGTGTAAMWRGQAQPACDVFKVTYAPHSPALADTVGTHIEARQFAPESWGYGGIYVVSYDTLMRYPARMWPAAVHEIPRARGLDIDTELDRQIVVDQYRRQHAAEYRELIGSVA